jgi:hypothetical protein
MERKKFPFRFIAVVPSSGAFNKEGDYKYTRFDLFRVKKYMDKVTKGDYGKEHKQWFVVDPTLSPVQQVKQWYDIGAPIDRLPGAIKKGEILKMEINGHLTDIKGPKSAFEPKINEMRGLLRIGFRRK